jgi:uncharacterized protein YndB with AHSA1/START domain
MKMNVFLTLLLSLFLPISGLCGPTPTVTPEAAAAVTLVPDENPWVPTGDKDGIKTFKRRVPGSKVLSFRGEGTIERPLTKVFQVLFDTTRATEWISDLEECRIIREVTETEFIEYDHVGTPPLIMKDRDFVSRVTIEAEPASRRLIMRYEAAEDPDMPPLGKFVRGELTQTVYTLTASEDGKSTFVTAEIHCDPKGGVAKWIVNWFQKGWPRTTFRNMRRQSAKPDIPDWEPYKRIMNGS